MEPERAAFLLRLGNAPSLGDEVLRLHCAADSGFLEDSVTVSLDEWPSKAHFAHLERQTTARPGRPGTRAFNSVPLVNGHLRAYAE